MKALRQLFSPDAVRQTLDSVAHRFPFSFAYVSALVVWLVVMVYECTETYHVVNDSVCWVLFEGFIMSLAAALWCEYLDKDKTNRVIQICILALVVVDFIVLCMRGGVSHMAEFIGRAAMTTAFAAAIFFLPSVKRLDRRQLWHYTVCQLGAVAMAVFIGAVMALSCLIIFSSINILFRFDEYKPMVTAMCILAVWVPAVVYLSRIPLSRDISSVDLPTSSPVGAFCKNVMLPLVGVYMLILYVYAAKILFTWELPQASITWMVTGLMCVSLIMLYGMQRYSFGDEISASAVKIYTLVRRILPIALIPLLVLMSIGLFYRVGEYGVTVSRLYVAAFNIWAYAVMLYLVFKNNANLNFVAVSFAVVFALVSMVPGMNFTSIADRAIRSSVIDALRVQGVETFPISEERLVDILEEMNRKEADNLASRIEYLDDWDDHSRVSDIVRSDEKLAVWRLLPYCADGTEVEVVEPVYDFILDASDEIEMPAGFSKVMHVTSWGSRRLDVDSCGLATLEYNGYKTKINIDSMLVIKEMNTPLSLAVDTADGREGRLVFTHLQLENDSIPTIVNPRYYLFTK